MNNPAKNETNADQALASQTNRIIKRFGGRHLIFRTKTGGWWMLPKPYVLISSFRGPVWVFYGVGQIWVTHKKLREISGWMVRVPRFVNATVTQIVDKLEPGISEFINFCNQHGIEGTLVIERKLIEFHWTFGDELDLEKHKKEHAESLESSFRTLCDQYLIVKGEMGI
jgi:hypothetical protein